AELRRHAVERPVVVAIDDTQWLDSASARALRYALRRIDREPVGVIATLRAGAGCEDPLRGEDVLPPGPTYGLEPAPLAQDELRDVLAGTVAAISRPLLARIHEISGGNPLYAVQLARSLPKDTSAYDTVVLPDSLHAAIAEHLETVPPELGPLLDTASALGPTSAQELRTSVEGDVDALLAAAEKHGVLVIEDDLTVRFAHPLLGSAVYRRLSPLARRSVHARLARLTRADDRRARHLALSTDEPDADVARLLD